MVLLTFRFVLVSILVQRKFTTDRYVVYKWSGCKYSPSPQGEGLFSYFGRNDGTNEKTGFYIIKDIIEKKEQSGKPCDILHIVKWADNRESVFLIRDIKCFYHIIHNWI